MKRFAVALLILGGVWAAEESAAATVLLDTTAGAVPGPLGDILSNDGGGGGQSLAVSFTTGVAVTITTVKTFIQGTGAFDVGILADSSGLPDGAFLDFLTLTDPVSPQSNSVSWSLAAGTYWLAAFAEVGASGVWNPSTSSGPYAFANGTSGWQLVTIDPFPPAALVIADEEPIATPEPASMALLGFGLIGMGWLRRRHG